MFICINDLENTQTWEDCKKFLIIMGPFYWHLLLMEIPQIEKVQSICRQTILGVLAWYHKSGIMFPAMFQAQIELA